LPQERHQEMKGTNMRKYWQHADLHYPYRLLIWCPLWCPRHPFHARSKQSPARPLWWSCIKIKVILSQINPGVSCAGALYNYHSVQVVSDH
jgi:hypothetical protein